MSTKSLKIPCELHARIKLVAALRRAQVQDVARECIVAGLSIVERAVNKIRRK